MKLLASLTFSFVSLGLAPAVWAGRISENQIAGVSFENRDEALFLTVASHADFLASTLDEPGGPADGPLYGPGDPPPPGDLPGNGSDSPPEPPGYSPNLPGDSQAPEPGSAFLVGAGLLGAGIVGRLAKRT